MDRLVFSIYSRGEKLNRIRCRRIRVSIFHKIGEGRNTGKLRFKKNTRGSIFSTVTRYFSKTLCGSTLPGRKKLRYAHARNPADRVSFREFVNSALQIGMESRILNVSSVRSFCNIRPRINVFILRLIEIREGFELIYLNFCDFWWIGSFLFKTFFFIYSNRIFASQDIIIV